MAVVEKMRRHSVTKANLANLNKKGEMEEFLSAKPNVEIDGEKRRFI